MIELVEEFQKAIVENNIVAIKQLLDKPNSKIHLDKIFIDNRKQTLLHFAVLNDRDEVVLLLLQYKISINITDLDGRSALHVAVIQNTEKCAKILLENKASPLQPDSTGKTPIHEAAHRGVLAILIKMFEILTPEQRMKAVKMVDDYGKLPLHYAASQSQDSQVLAYLIKQGANIDELDVNLNTPLHYAVVYGHLENVKMLMANRAQVHLQNKEGYTPATYAAHFRHKEIALYIQDAAFIPILQQQLLEIQSSNTLLSEKELEERILAKVSLYTETAWSELNQQIKEEQEGLENLSQQLLNQRGQLEKQKQEILSHMSIIQNIQQQDDRLRNEMEIQKLQLTNLSEQETILWKEFESKKEQKEALDYFKHHPNLVICYKTIQIKLEELLISCKAAAGGMVTLSKGTLGKVQQGIQLVGTLIPLTNVVTNALSIISAPLEMLDETRQSNTAANISSLMTLSELKKIAEKTARAFTYWYEPLLKRLVAPEVELGEIESKKTFKEKFKKAKKKITKEGFNPPAKQFAEFGIVWVLEALHEQPDYFRRIPSLEKEFIRIITTQTIPEMHADASLPTKIVQGFKQVKFKLINNLHTKTVQAINENKIEDWPLWDCYTKAGIRTDSGELYASNTTNTIIYGYCQGTEEAAKMRGLRLIGQVNKKQIIETAIPPNSNERDLPIFSAEKVADMTSKIEKLEVINASLETRVSQLENIVSQLLVSQRNEKTGITKEISLSQYSQFCAIPQFGGDKLRQSNENDESIQTLKLEANNHA